MVEKSAQRKKERKKKKGGCETNQLGFKTLNVFLRVSLFKTSLETREEKDGKKKCEKTTKKTKKDDERKPLGVHALPNLTPALEILAIVRVSSFDTKEQRRRTFTR